MEFDTVLVVENYMGVNEMYVSYTRALDNLIITTIDDSSFTTEVDIEDDDREDAEDDSKENSPPVLENEVNADIKDGEREEAGDDRKEEPVPENRVEVEGDEPRRDETEIELPVLPLTPLNTTFEESIPYMNAFFKSSPAYVNAFRDMAAYAIEKDAGIRVHVSNKEIGLALTEEEKPNRGGYSLVGKSLMGCHSPKSRELIEKVINRGVLSSFRGSSEPCL